MRCLRLRAWLAALVVGGTLLGPVTSSPASSRADARLVVEKSARTLHLWVGDELVATVPVGLGFSPVGDKLREGDGATPEGRYRVCVKNPQSRYYLSVGLDYPNGDDAAAALDRGQISAAEADAIVRAGRRGVCPPWNTSLGGEIYIHGRGSSADWTLGCVALDDPAMKTVFDTVSVGTEVWIRP